MPRKFSRQRGFSPATVETARRFFNGQLTPGQFLPAMMKFGKAYYYHPNPLALAMLLGLRVKMRPEAHVYAFSRLLQGWTVMDRLSEIQTPTLVLAGRHDFQFPPEHQAALARGISNAQLKIIEEAGHNAPMEQPAEVIQAVRNFLAARESHETG